jgi:hypothetical protein
MSGMMRGFLALLAAFAAVAVPAAAQIGAAQPGIILFEGVEYSGERRDFPNAVTDLDTYRFNDRARSVVIDDRAWEICEDANFEGRCVRLDRDAPNLGAVGLSGKVSSARPLSEAVAPPAALLLYGQTGMRGRPLRLVAGAANLQAQGFNDTARSLSAERPWQVCAEPNYAGRCQVVSGEVADLREFGLNRAISSARPYEQVVARGRTGPTSLRGRTAAFFATTNAAACPRANGGEECHQTSADAFCRRSGFREAGYFTVDRRQRPARLGDVLCLR